ncbi:MAG TPA: oligopeptide transporter, OPT family [Polyangiaceae bacterium]|nr:oligopeptide transporter, OPT family [Polyangiaceae bacterium]
MVRTQPPPREATTEDVERGPEVDPRDVVDPYVPPDVSLPELTPLPLIVGTLLGVVFGASSLYLVLKVGLTVSASIPVAVISITFFRFLSKLGVRNATILENNIVQTAGSAGESLAFGVGVTMPALLILGFDLEVSLVTLVSLLGGLLGILMMIPLRRALIVEQHHILKYPEGTACAEVLKAGASAESRAAAGSRASGALHDAAGGNTIFVGFGVGLAYKAAMVVLRAWKDIPEKIFTGSLKAGSVSAEISPELLGVGYIIGPRISAVMAAGGALAYLVLIPIIQFFGENLAGPLPPGTIPIHDMTPQDIRGAYVLYIGAGAVAAGGVISLVRSLPTIWRGMQGGMRDLRMGSRRDGGGEVPRTDRDLSMKTVLIGCIVLLTAITLAPPLRMNLGGAILILFLGFLFVTVSSRLTGEIGSSSSPTSGMTVATLLLTCGIFLLLGWTAPRYYVTALAVGAIVCIAISNGGTTSQDLKTGHLIGATPRAQQLAILVGTLASAVVLGPILLKLNAAATVYVPPTLTEGDRVVEIFDRGLRTDPADLQRREHLSGPQGKEDAREYLVWQKLDDKDGPRGKYLVDPSGKAVYLVDPGVNGTHSVRPDGSRVSKFDAPKATLMSYIIKGILNRELPWTLVILGVMIAVVLELSGIPSLAFAVGVYLPLSSSTPLLAGGIVRWLVDRQIRRRPSNVRMTEAELEAEGDKSPGVLLSSGYIAGGAIAGIVIAFMAGLMDDLTASIDAWSSAHNPFFGGDHADLLSMVPFTALAAMLYFVGSRDARDGALAAR